jgi:hypothetical protein
VPFQLGGNASPPATCLVSGLPGLAGAADAGSVRSSASVARAFVPPVVAEFLVVQPAELMRVMVESVGGALHLVEVMAVIAGGVR